MSERKTLEQFRDEVSNTMTYLKNDKWIVPENFQDLLHFAPFDFHDRVRFDAFKLFHDQEMKAKDAEIDRLSYRVIEAENCEELTAEIQYLKQQLSEREWISVDDRLPESGRDVMHTNFTIKHPITGQYVNPLVSSGYFHAERGFRSWIDIRDEWYPTHWMYYPIANQFQPPTK